MARRATPGARRTAAWFIIAGAGVALTGGTTAWAGTTPTPSPSATCGTPAHPALYRTVQHDAVPPVTSEVTVIDQPAVPGSPAVDEVSHVELTTVDGDGTPGGEGWTPTGKTWTIEDSAAWTEYQWQRTVIDQPGVPGSPAVPAVTHEETVVVTPAWTEKVIDVEEWTESVPGEWWNWSPNRNQGPFDGPPAFPTDERGTWQGPHSNGGPGPEEEGTYNISNGNSGRASWFHRGPKTEIVHPQEFHLVHHEAVTRTETVVDVEAVPAVPAIEEVSHVETSWTRSKDTAPEGEGWELTGEEVHHEATTHIRHEWSRTVVDTPASPAVPGVPEVSHVEVVVEVPGTPAWTEQVLVSPAVPAGPPCAVLPAGSTNTPTRVTPAGASPTAVSPASLAQTGLDVAVPLGAGVAMVLVGGALVAVRRRTSG